MSPLTLLLALSLLGSVAGLIGGLIFLLKKDLAKALAVHAIPFAAGVLLSLSFLELFPEALSLIGSQVFPLVLAVFLALFVIELFLFHLHHHEEESTAKAIPLVIFGDTIHNFLDGVAIGSSFLVNPSLGFFVALATFFHETPHEIGDFGILLSAGWSRKKTFLANFFSALATIPGALGTYFFAPLLVGSQGILLAVACGIFLYIAATDFLPEVGRKPKDVPWHQAFFLFLGVALMIVLKTFLPD